MRRLFNRIGSCSRIAFDNDQEAIVSLRSNQFWKTLPVSDRLDYVGNMLDTWVGGPVAKIARTDNDEACAA
jgi:hypothetical protein